MYDATCTWTPGTSNVDHQKYTWFVDGTEVASGSLQASESTRSSVQDNVTINPEDSVAFSVVSVNQWAQSDPATAAGTAPTPVPEAPSGVQMVITEIGAARR